VLGYYLALRILEEILNSSFVGNDMRTKVWHCGIFSAALLKVKKINGIKDCC